MVVNSFEFCFAVFISEFLNNLSITYQACMKIALIFANSFIKSDILVAMSRQYLKFCYLSKFCYDSNKLMIIYKGH